LLGDVSEKKAQKSQPKLVRTGWLLEVEISKGGMAWTEENIFYWSFILKPADFS
jgi:hypothetical protein